MFLNFHFPIVLPAAARVIAGITNIFNVKYSIALEKIDLWHEENE